MGVWGVGSGGVEWIGQGWIGQGWTGQGGTEQGGTGQGRAEQERIGQGVDWAGYAGSAKDCAETRTRRNIAEWLGVVGRL